MIYKCSVITGVKDGKYVRCGLDATHEALPWRGLESDWRYCAGHAKYYAEANGYPIKPIEINAKEEDDDQKIRSGCNSIFRLSD